MWLRHWKIRTNYEDNFCFDGTTLREINNGLSGIVSLKRRLELEHCFGIFDGMGGEKNTGRKLLILLLQLLPIR